MPKVLSRWQAVGATTRCCARWGRSGTFPRSAAPSAANACWPRAAPRERFDMAAHALILAIPSKGRLQEQVTHYLADAGLVLKQVTGARDYRATIAGEPGIDVKLMSSAEIAARLASGEVHFGVNGEDLIRATVPSSDAAIALLQPLGLGFADVVVAVPRAWIDVASMP